MTSTSVAFDKARAEDRAALIGYLPAGFPSVEGSIRAMRTMVEAGCDAIEVGLPYSDPVMDGPTIQDAAQQALDAGVRTRDVIEVVRAVAETGVPTLVMTYWNPVERYGVERWASDLAAAGGAGLITPDITPDHGSAWIAAADEHDLDKVFLVAPSSTPDRLAAVTAACRGFIYATAVMGVTGARTSVGEAADALVSRTRAHTDLPVCVGLGVSTSAQAAEVGRYADGVIVGSALVRCLTEAATVQDGLEALGGLARELADGVRRSRS